MPRVTNAVARRNSLCRFVLVCMGSVMNAPPNPVRLLQVPARADAASARSRRVTSSAASLRISGSDGFDARSSRAVNSRASLAYSLHAKSSSCATAAHTHVFVGRMVSASGNTAQRDIYFRAHTPVAMPAAKHFAPSGGPLVHTNDTRTSLSAQVMPPSPVTTRKEGGAGAPGSPFSPL